MRRLSKHLRVTSRILTLALLALIGVGVAEAQESAAGQQQPGTAESIIRQADEDLRLWESRRELDFAQRADRQLRSLLCKHPDSPLREQIEDRLAIVREPLAEHSLTVALHYLKRFEEGKAPHAKGAKARLHHILCEYPKFSRIDEVLDHLLRMYNLTGETEAAKSVQQLMNELPGARNYQQACEDLRRF